MHTVCATAVLRSRTQRNTISIICMYHRYEREIIHSPEYLLRIEVSCLLYCRPVSSMVRELCCTVDDGWSLYRIFFPIFVFVVVAYFEVYITTDEGGNLLRRPATLELEEKLHLPQYVELMNCPSRKPSGRPPGTTAVPLAPPPSPSGAPTPPREPTSPGAVPTYHTERRCTKATGEMASRTGRCRRGPDKDSPPPPSPQGYSSSTSSSTSHPDRLELAVLKFFHAACSSSAC